MVANPEYGKIFIRFGKYEINEVLDFLPYDEKGKHNRDIPSFRKYENFSVCLKSLRYKTFKIKGTKCAKCGLEASYFILERQRHQKTTKVHFNLYGINKDGEEIMFTKDHIIPFSKGGKTDIKNMQTMCIICNGEKGNEMKEFAESHER